MKYKALNKQQLIISIDRLTRFKPTYEKYFRVFSDIVLSNLIEPKFKKNELETIDLSELCNFAQIIINSSLENSNPNFGIINQTLKNYENDLFINQKNTQKLLDNKIDYLSIINLLSNEQNLPLNLQWLCYLKNSKNQETSRENYGLKFPLSKLVITEGITEEILIPTFAKLCGYDFDKKGIQIISAGGKNQVVKSYYRFADIIKIPVFVLLDADAEENAVQINKKLRPSDKIHLVSCGEFEDLLPKSLITKTLNTHFKNFSEVKKSDFVKHISTVKQLEILFKEKGLHEFKKSEFAKLVSKKITISSDISDEIRKIIDEISNNLMIKLT